MDKGEEGAPAPHGAKPLKNFKYNFDRLVFNEHITADCHKIRLFLTLATNYGYKLIMTIKSKNQQNRTAAKQRQNNVNDQKFNQTRNCSHR